MAASARRTRSSCALLAPLTLLALSLLSVAAAGPVDPEDLKLQLDASQSVTLTAADGTQRELTTEEFEQLARQHAEEHAKLQKNPAPDGDDQAWTWQQDQLADIRAQDPQFALHIDLARRAFAELQRHGYARGYTLAGFSEQKTDAPPRFEGEWNLDYRAQLVLRVKQDEKSGVTAKTGTGTKKNGRAPMEMTYEVHLLLDKQQRFSVVSAWELDGKPTDNTKKRQWREKKLTIQPTAALLERRAEIEHQKLLGGGFGSWLLAGGLALIVAGLLVMYNTRNPVPAPRPRRRSSEVWELVEDKKPKPKAKPTVQDAAADKKNK